MAVDIELSGWGWGWGHRVQRKVFRIEQMFAAGHAGATEQRYVVDELKTLRTLTGQHDGSKTHSIANLKQELAQIQETIARNKRELASLIGDGKERSMARAGDELRAAVDGMDYATQKILKSVEIIDEIARSLTASLKDDYKCSLAQEIQDHVVQIYEACNFQDIAGQRIGNVIGTMTMAKDQVAAMIDRRNGVDGRNETPGSAKPASERGLLNGPKLDGDSGHTSQNDIDALFK